ncbi:MAG: NAD-dependent epimerase/dehydratase family protein [Pseudomonas sp.]|uniref:NAD-dependent epimerase/dehydratase family protein n=1 Tax=Pseudomonas sp. TaxID=306 RepID=UPI003D6F7656
MKILIVGGTSSLAQALNPVLSQFSEVVTAGRAGCDLTLDLASPAENIQIPSGIDVVINAAASFPGTAAEDLRHAQEVNVSGLLKLCEACTKSGVGHLVHISSIFARLDQGSPMFGAYSLTKRHAEDAAELYSRQFGLPLTILQPSQFYSIGNSQRKHQALLYTMIDRAEKNEDIFIYGKHDALRNFIHINDIAQIIARVVQTGTLGKFACTSTSNSTLSELAAAAIKAFGSTSRVKFLEDKPDVADIAFAVDDDLYQRIDYRPKISILEGMRKEAEHRRSIQPA